MFASIWDTINNLNWFSAMANVWQWFFSILGVPGIILACHTRLVNRCIHCWWRKGEVPISGSVHRSCKKHAQEHGYTH